MRTIIRSAFLGAVAMIVVVAFCSKPSRAAERVSVGIAETDITPDVDGPTPVWIAGYGQNRRATGVHDPLMARAIVFRQGGKKIALAVVDLVGLQYPTVRAIREKLSGFSYVMVASTHNHEGPDTIGMWGPSIARSGVDPKYMATMIDRVAETIRRADANAVPAVASYGTATDNTLLRDSRLPEVYDGVLRAVKFSRSDNEKPIGVLVQWSSHPEAMGSKNTLITADFPVATIAVVRKKYGVPVIYFSGAVGGLMTPPRQRIQNAAGEYLGEGDFEYARRYGEAVGRLAVTAIESSEPIKLSPLKAAAKPITAPLANPLYILARSLGVMKRDGRIWTGDFEELGKPLTPGGAKGTGAIETEVAYVRLGDLHVAGIPGELYPEMVYGDYQEPVDPNADFPDAPLEKPIVELLPGDKILLIGLANDEIGYIVPKRQWDDKKPFAYGRDKKQYGEVNSIGPETAPIIMKALENRIREAAAQE